MKKTIVTLLLSVFFFTGVIAQTLSSVKGKIVDSESQETLADVTVTVNETSLSVKTDAQGLFVLTNVPVGNQVVQISLAGYETQSFPVNIEEGKELDLGTVFLFVDLSTVEEDSGLISLTEDDLNDDDGSSENTAGLLQASRDVFQNRAAFDFGQGFFRIRGYDSQNATVLINGISMNKLFNGRPQWNNWGGLNDITRNQELTSGLTPSSYTFGGILGTTNITTRASKYRPGLRISGSYSNRTYGGRGMVTYSSGLQKSGFAYTVSASRRWSNEGFIDGTLYDAYSVFGALEYQLNDKHSLNASAMFAPNRRGQSTAITEQDFNLAGRTYNPNWGYQDGDKRNSRVRDIEEPIFMLSHFYEGEKTSLTSSIAYQTGKQGRSRIDYANAQNPAPNYYRIMPNYYLNLEEGADLANAELARQNFLANPQVNWTRLYEANLNTTNAPDPGNARYMLYEDRSDDDLLTINSTLNTELNNNLTLDISATYKNLTSDNFATPLDLLGAEYYSDINTFSGARNDVNGTIQKGIGDRVRYNFDINSDQFNLFSQLQFSYDKVDFFLSGSYTNTSYQREGKFLNESFADNSLGKSEKLSFDDFGVKGGLTYKITGRHLLQVNAGYLTQAPTIRNSFSNSRENNGVVSNLESEKITTAEASYIVRTPIVKGRLTGYYTDFKDGTEINFFFAQGGSGTDFFQEAVTRIDKRHIGLELGVEVQITPTIKASAVAAVGEYTFTDDANTVVNFDTFGSLESDLINLEGFEDLGTSYIKDYKVASGPQQAFSLGLEYRDPKFWWIGVTGNYLDNNYVDISTNTRTDSFFINPDDPQGFPFPFIDETLTRQLLTQEKFDGYYLLNLTGGKSWRVKGTYISLFASINNLFDETFKTGGFEQSRTANYGDLVQDTANGTRSFGNRYWYGFGRSYFVNFAISF